MSSNLPAWMILDTDDEWGDEVEDKITSYSFYRDSPEGEVVLYYDDAAHAYYRFDAEGQRVDIPGVTTVLQIVDKSKPLMLWAVKLAINTVRSGLYGQDGRLQQISTEDLEILLADAKDKHNQHLVDAGDVGHIVHDILERAIKKAIAETDGVITDIDTSTYTDERVVNSTSAAMEWISSHKVKFILTERKIYSREFEVAGTGDGLAFVSSCDDPLCCPEFYVDRKDWIDWKTSNKMNSTYPAQTAIYLFSYVEETGERVVGRWVIKLNKETGKLEVLYRGPEKFAMDLESFLSCLKLTKDWRAMEKDIQEQKAVQRAARKAIKDEQKAIKEALEKAERAQAKVARMEATRLRNEAKDILYKKLRAEGVSVLDAKAQVAAEYPTPLRNFQDLIDELPEDRRQKIEEQAQEIISAHVNQQESSDPDLEWSINL